MRNQSKIISVLKEQKKRVGSKRIIVSTKRKLDYIDLVEAASGNVDIQYNSKLIKESHRYVQDLMDKNAAVYGITTSFGGNVKHVIQTSETNHLQHNLITSHASSVGSIFPYEFCKGAMILRLLTISKGYSGVSLRVIHLLQQMVEKGIVPAIPAHGSMGASGDLNPLSAVAHAMMGHGEVYLPDRKTIIPTKKAFSKYRLKPVRMTHRDGLALINGTSLMTTIGCFYTHYLNNLILNSLVIGAMTIEALRSSKEPFDSRLHKLKPHYYQRKVAKMMSGLLKGSKLALSNQELKLAVEEELKQNGNSGAAEGNIDLQGGSYSMRAIPQIYQPIMALMEVFQESVFTEINSIDDNPIFMAGRNARLHGANFHGHPISVTADSLNIALLSIANISNARIDRMLKSQHSGLPAFLSTGQPGLHLGLQGAQYTAAGICAEMRALSFPLSVNQVPTNNDNQDMVSFGMQATIKGIELTTLLAYVLAVEYVAAGQGLWLRFQEKEISQSWMSPFTRASYKKLLSIYNPRKNKDQSFTVAVEKVAEFLLLDQMMPANMQKELWR